MPLWSAAPELGARAAGKVFPRGPALVHRAPQPQGSATGIWPEALKYYALLSSRDDESV